MFKRLTTFNGDLITGQGFKTPRGDFNKDYYIYAQILDKPLQDASISVIKACGISEVNADDLKPATEITPFIATNEKKPSQREVWNNVVSSQHLLWSPRAMHGAEYENGGFQAYVAKFARQGKLVFEEQGVRVSTRSLPSIDDMVTYGVQGETLDRVLKKKYGIELNWSVDSTVYIIAPQHNMVAAREMINHLASQHIEQSSHRGIGFNKAAVYQTLSSEDQEKVSTAEDYTAPAAWFDIQNGVFFTLDKDMFEKAKIAFSATAYEPTVAKIARFITKCGL